jgi:hypothetical protein
MASLLSNTTARSGPAREILNDEPLPEPWGKRLWLTLAAVILVASVILSYGINKWPMADDEVPTLAEIGAIHIDGQAFSVPADQIEKLPQALPVFYAIQRRAFALVPHNEMGFRIPSLVCAILTAALAFLLAARWRGLWFASAFSIVQLGSLPFLLLSQVDRFYSMTLLFVALTFTAVCVPRRGVWMILLTAALAALSVLSHNITAAVFVLAFAAACGAYVLGPIPLHIPLRSGAAALVGVLLYVLYLRPIVSGWHGTGNPTPVLISFAAQAGIPALALALFGCCLAVVRRRDSPSMIGFALMFAGSVCFLQLFQITGISMSPRYFLFFLPAIWALAAYAMDFVARRIGPLPAAGSYACVVVLLLPTLASHYQDGTRHDYRQAAAVVLAQANDGQRILSDDAETISYYLPEEYLRRLYVRTKVTHMPETEFFLVCRMNAWMPLPRIAGRRMDLLAEISHRRFDSFSHILRIYRVQAVDTIARHHVPPE